MRSPARTAALLAAVVTTWEAITGEVVGIDALEVARDIALRIRTTGRR